jgi:hypothetical protein
MLVLRASVPAVCALAVRVRAVRLRAGRVVVLVQQHSFVDVADTTFSARAEPNGPPPS